MLERVGRQSRQMIRSLSTPSTATSSGNLIPAPAGVDHLLAPDVVAGEDGDGLGERAQPSGEVRIIRRDAFLKPVDVFAHRRVRGGRVDWRRHGKCRGRTPGGCVHQEADMHGFFHGRESIGRNPAIAKTRSDLRKKDIVLPFLKCFIVFRREQPAASSPTRSERLFPDDHLLHPS